MTIDEGVKLRGGVFGLLALAVLMTSCTESSMQAPGSTVSPDQPVSMDANNTGVLALMGGTLIDGTGTEPIAASVVLIKDERIICAGSLQDCEIPVSANVVSTEGKWLTPGLIDGHVHFSQTGWVDARPDIVNVSNLYPYDQVMADNSHNPERYYRSYLCSGVTAVFDVGGYPWSWLLRKHAENDPFAPHIAATGPLVANFAIPVRTPGDQQFIGLDSAETASSVVHYMKANNTDAIKLYYIPVAPEELKAFHSNIRSLAKEAKQAGIRIVAHTQSYHAAKFIIETGTSILVHSVGDKLVDDEFIELVKAQNVLYMPTLTVGAGYEKLAEAVQNARQPVIDDPNACVDRETLEKIHSSDELGKYVTEKSGLFNDWDTETSVQIQTTNLKRLHDAGVMIVTATDAGNPLTVHGPSIYAEMEAMQEAGLSPMQVLVASTHNGAMALGRIEDIGTVEKDKIADILILSADPTKDIRNMRYLESVIRAGHIHTQESLRAH